MSLQFSLKLLKSPQRVILHDLQLEVAPGTIHTVMGASGSGKSSLLAALCGALPLGLRFEGDMYLSGRRIDHLPTEQRGIGLLFQDDLLFAHMTVEENLRFAVPTVVQGVRQSRQARQSQVLAGLRAIEMTDFAQADPTTLSGGQRTRVALMRALLAQPQALLLDEPFAKLDTPLRARMRGMVFEQVRQRGITALLVTHDDADIADPRHLTVLTPAKPLQKTPTHVTPVAKPYRHA